MSVASLHSALIVTFSDDNGNINDGTPHMTAIFEAFNTQEIACNTPSVKDSGCEKTPQVAPQVTVSPGNMQAVISWTSVAGASNYEVFRTEGVKQCSQGKVKLASTTSTSLTDTGLMNGREYYYIVIAKGPASSCFGPASACMTVTPKSTKVCGNGHCDFDEDSATCSTDCDRKLYALYEGSYPRGATGVMFSVESKSRDVEISSFQFFTGYTVHTLIQVYTRAGQFDGFESSETEWDLVHNATQQLGGANTLTTISLSSKLEIPAGTSRSFFLWSGSPIRYRVGKQIGSVTNSDSLINLYDGLGLMKKFSGDFLDVYNPRSFVGIIG